MRDQNRIALPGEVRSGERVQLRRPVMRRVL
jgi:hypothetical protein